MMCIPRMDQELAYQGTDVMTLFHMGATCEDVRAPDLLDHPDHQEGAKAGPPSI
jgi:hypothetical protein